MGSYGKGAMSGILNPEMESSANEGELAPASDSSRQSVDQNSDSEAKESTGDIQVEITTSDVKLNQTVSIKFYYNEIRNIYMYK